MPPKRKNSRSKARGRKQPAPTPRGDTMADCVLPSEIMLCILSRLPVKSIHRFKAVCKPWRKLFATPRFVKLHYGQFSNIPENQNFMVYSVSRKPGARHTISLFEMESDAKNPTNLDHPYPQIIADMDFVGCLSGLVCLSFPVYGQWIHLWNPALNLDKHLPLPNVDTPKYKSGEEEWVSVGFGYDDEAHDFKVVRIGCWGSDETNTGAEEYSTKMGSWREIKTGLKFRIFTTKCDAIVGGNPYWIVRVDENVSDKSHILWFDVKKSKFRMVPSSNIVLARDSWLMPLMDWEGSLAAIAWQDNREREGFGFGFGFASVLVFDVDKGMWNRACFLGPIEMNVERCLQCSRNGKIIGSCSDGKLFVLDSSTEHVKVIEVEDADMLSFRIFEYSQSLVTVDGMKPVKHSEIQDEDDNVDLAWFFRRQMRLLGGNNAMAF